MGYLLFIGRSGHLFEVARTVRRFPIFLQLAVLVVLATGNAEKAEPSAEPVLVNDRADLTFSLGRPRTRRLLTPLRLILPNYLQKERSLISQIWWCKQRRSDLPRRPTCSKTSLPPFKQKRVARFEWSCQPTLLPTLGCLVCVMLQKQILQGP